MKLMGKNIALSIGVMLICAASRTQAQEPRLRIDALDPLTAKAVESVEVSLNQSQLQFVRKLARLDRREGRDQLANFDGVYVRLLEFDEDGAYASGDVEQIRTQLRAQGWSPYQASAADGRDMTGAYVMVRDGGIIGYAAFQTEARKICLINLTGRISQEDLNDLQGSDCKAWGGRQPRRGTR